MKQFMEAELAVPCHNACGEAPLWDSGLQTLFWTDCTGLQFFRFSPATGDWEVLSDGVEVYGFRKNRAGGFVLTNLSGIWLWDGHGAMLPVLTALEDRPCQANDCTADSRGRFLTATFYYNPADIYPLGKLISLSPSGRVQILDDGYHLANGLALSPDEKTLYATDTAARRIYAYDYDIETGSATRRRTLVEVGRQEGIPDGLTVDSEGCLWSAQWYGGCVVRYDPGGRIVARIRVPAKQVSSVAFGGAELTDLYITTAAKSEPMPLMPAGYDPDHGPFGGPLYRVRTEVAGLPAREAAIPLGSAAL